MCCILAVVPTISRSVSKNKGDYQEFGHIWFSLNFDLNDLDLFRGKTDSARPLEIPAVSGGKTISLENQSKTKGRRNDKNAAEMTPPKPVTCVLSELALKGFFRE